MSQCPKLATLNLCKFLSFYSFPAIFKRYCFIPFLLLFLINVNAQSLNGYEFNTMEADYEPLEDYESIQILAGGNFNWEMKFEPDFDILIFGERYSSFFVDFFSAFYGPNDEWVLDLNSYPYHFDLIPDTFDIQSDVRFAT